MPFVCLLPPVAIHSSRLVLKVLVVEHGRKALIDDVPTLLLRLALEARVRVQPTEAGILYEGHGALFVVGGVVDDV